MREAIRIKKDPCPVMNGTGKTDSRAVDGYGFTSRVNRGIAARDRRRILHAVYERFHRAEFISPDPLEVLYRYRDRLDREIAGIIASSLAYGRVAQILASVDTVLGRMGPSPRAFLEDTGSDDLREIFTGFKHRFTTDAELVAVLTGVRDTLRRHGSLQACFMRGIRAGDETTIPALAAFSRSLYPACGDESCSLIPDPARKSACKRLHLFLRWMVRCDEIDPGGWEYVDPAKLVIPLDTHMHRICRQLGMTERSQGDEKTALEITGVFREIMPEDPVRYDFSLTRLGMMKGDAGLTIEQYRRPNNTR